jgi:uncharacterized protein YbjT (DUF2867 family)
MRIAIVGATGSAGSALVTHARTRGHEVRGLARSTGVDLVTGRGLDDALQDVEAVIDASNTSATRRSTAVAWFERTSGHLTAAAARAEVRHLVPLSIVGIDDVPMGYYAGKQAQEHVVRSSPVPWTIVRASQFFSFACPFLERSWAGVAIVPALRCQPVAVDAVARLVIDVVESPVPGDVVQIAGPRETDTITMARRISARRGGPRVWPLFLPGATGRAVRAGGLLPAAGARIDEQDFDEWLAR